MNYFLLILFVSHSIILKGQDLSISIERSYSESKGYAKGIGYIQVNGYGLKESIAKILDIEQKYIIMSDGISDVFITVKVTYKGHSKLTTDLLKESFFKKLQENFPIQIKEVNQVKPVYMVSNPISTFECTNSNNGEIQNIAKINRTWNGKCVRMLDVVKQLNEWYPDIFLTNSKSEN